MTREEAIKVLNHIIESYKTFPKMLCKIPRAEERKNEYVDALKVAIEALSADTVSREVYDKRIQADEKIIDNYRQEFQKVLSADAVSREDYHNLLIASNDIDRALREYQDKEENGELVSVVRCKDCYYWYKKMNKCDRCPSICGNWWADDFCSWGERREK